MSASKKETKKELTEDKEENIKTKEEAKKTNIESDVNKKAESKAETKNDKLANKSENKTKNKSEVKEKNKTQNKTKNKSVSKSENKTQSKPEEKKESKTANKTKSKSENKTASNAKNKSDDKSANKSKNKIEDKTTNKQEDKSETEKSKTKKFKKVEKDDKTNKSKKEKQEVKEEPKKEDKEKSNKLIPVEEKPEYVKDMLKKSKRRLIIAIISTVIIVIFLMLSTIFALLNLNNTNIIAGVKVKNIDLSNLSIEDSVNKLKDALNSELIDDVKLQYKDEYEISISPSQVEFEYDVQTAVNTAYNVGRTGNILQNNYKILFSTLFGEKLGIKYAYNDDFLNEFVDDISSKIPGLVVNPSYYIEDGNLIINQGKDGIVVKKEELKELILNSIENRKYENIYNDNYNPIIQIPVEECKALAIDMEKIYSEVRRDPQDAYFELEPYQIYPEQDGIDFNLEEAKKTISQYQEEYTIPLTITKASKTIKDLGTEAFPYLISSFSTKYDASNVNRSTNLVIAANKINGTVLLPGEVFSYNKVVGKRTVEEGYKDAKIYADGGVVDGLAGGICQISSTLYNAVLLANLEIVERRNHSYTTSYVAAGRDATVVYGAIDFQFKNSRNYPIKIEASVKSGVAEFKIHGMNEPNEYEIKILPVTTASIPYSVQYVKNPALAPGTQVVTQSGHAGYKVTTYIEKRLNGAVVSKEVLSNDIYSPMKTIINVAADVPVQ